MKKRYYRLQSGKTIVCFNGKYLSANYIKELEKVDPIVSVMEEGSRPVEAKANI